MGRVVRLQRVTDILAGFAYSLCRSIADRGPHDQAIMHGKSMLAVHMSLPRSGSAFPGIPASSRAVEIVELDLGALVEISAGLAAGSVSLQADALDFLERVMHFRHDGRSRLCGARRQCGGLWDVVGLQKWRQQYALGLAVLTQRCDRQLCRAARCLGRVWYGHGVAGHPRCRHHGSPVAARGNAGDAAGNRRTAPHAFGNRECSLKALLAGVF